MTKPKTMKIRGVEHKKVARRYVRPGDYVRGFGEITTVHKSDGETRVRFEGHPLAKIFARMKRNAPKETWITLTKETRIWRPV